MAAVRTMTPRAREILKLTEKARAVTASEPMSPGATDAIELLCQAVESLVTGSGPLWVTREDG